ncbi:hypothetical protein FGG90_15270 [Clavibacter tessellarius]|uniref:Uncharacterized protein n=2 Tax=Clavibacter tessellarius TaxID=31965 RepID=A0A225CAQ0_9MICO|nr:hypothetical protein B5P24_01505 [Clavibacter michiganensis subsp. tessellarius]UKF35462.1 hypothetical protein FGG90_15270 [Clavibacter michiganensis subsp. tessellarius]
MKAVVDRYLKSGDFNGLHLHTDVDPALMESAQHLVADGKLQVMVDGVDYPNPHIRPWPSKRTVESQIESIQELSGEGYGVVLYPTPSALKGVRVPSRLTGHPFSTAMAKGRGTLELAYFSFDVLEPYRNDPRYHFRYWDFGVDMGIGDDAYLDETELDRDKVSLSHLGFAYDLSGYDREDIETPIVRRVAAFYGDLAKLTPEHQQRWKSYLVSDAGLEPHPAWWMTQMGDWADGVGPFEYFFLQLNNLNTLWVRAFGEELFKHTEQPQDFGWLLRPSQREWDEFIVQLDKLLSENIRHQAMDAVGVRRKGDNDQNLGSLSRFAAFLEGKRIEADMVKGLMEPLRRVRQARQKPAHALRRNITDKTFVHRQVALLEELNDVLSALAQWLSKHPKNTDWKSAYGAEKYYRL